MVLRAEEGEPHGVTGCICLTAHDALPENVERGDGRLVAQHGERGEGEGGGVGHGEGFREENVCETLWAFNGRPWWGGKEGGGWQWERLAMDDGDGVMQEENDEDRKVGREKRGRHDLGIDGVCWRSFRR